MKIKQSSTKNIMTIDADRLRVEGNELLRTNNIVGAIEKYSLGLEIDPTDRLLLSNRSAAKLIGKDYDGALADADRCLEVAPRWPKSYLRKSNTLRALDDLIGAKTVCEEALRNLSEDDSDVVKTLLGELELDLFKKRLCGTWKGKVTAELGGYSQTMSFDSKNAMKVDVFNRTQTCKFSLDLSHKPVRLTVCFGDEPAATSVPYIVEFRDNDQTLAMCCPYLVPDIPSEFQGPGLVLMRKGEYIDEADRALEEKKAGIELISDPAEKLLRYLEDFALIIAKIPSNDPSNLDTPLDDQEIEANKKVLEVMATHVKVSELEQIYGKDVAKASFGVISGGDAFVEAPAKVQVAALRLRDLLLSSGFISPEGLEQARLQYTKALTSDTPGSSSKGRLQKKLLARRSEGHARLGDPDAVNDDEPGESETVADIAEKSVVSPDRSASTGGSGSAESISLRFVVGAAIVIVMIGWATRRLSSK